MPAYRPDPATITDLAGVAELSEQLGVSRQAISNWNAGRSRDGFPAPLARLRSGPIWSRHAVLSWWAQQKPSHTPGDTMGTDVSRKAAQDARDAVARLMGGDGAAFPAEPVRKHSR